MPSRKTEKNMKNMKKATSFLFKTYSTTSATALRVKRKPQRLSLMNSKPEPSKSSSTPSNQSKVR